LPLGKLFGNEEAPATLIQKGVGRTLSCISCGLYKDVLSPRMQPFGNFKKEIMIVGEGPGKTEDRRGNPWQGRAGGVVKDALEDLGISLFEDCVSVNAVNCRPPDNRAPTAHELACCRAKIVNPAIAEYSPRLILLMGASAVSSVLGSIVAEAQDAVIGKWRGFCIPVPDLGAWVCPTYHPSFVMREESKPEVETVWKSDIKRALKFLDADKPVVENHREKVTILRDEQSILRALHRARVRKGYFSFDYETTGLRASVQKLVCVSFCQSPDRAYSFMLDNASDAVRQAWREIMLDDKIGKISHNLNFESQWSRFHFDIDHIQWAWDSMLCAHVLDNRPGICSLKHQAFLNFGVTPYDDLVGPFLRSVDPRNPAAPNRIYEFIERYGQDELLIYNGIDSLVAFRLAMRQMSELGGS
jgi:uracil-DNA glycosylase family 4